MMETTEPSGDNAIVSLQPVSRQSRITQFFQPSGPGPAGSNGWCAKERRDHQKQKRNRPRLSFLSLPRAVRERVYHYANVPAKKVIDLNQWTEEEKPFWAESDGSDSETCGKRSRCISAHSFPSALLRVSHFLRDEVEERLYSQNAVTVALWRPDGLRPLERLSDNAIQQLRVLIVGLLPCKCLEPICWEHSPERIAISHHFAINQFRPPHQHSRRLDCISRRDRATIAQWKRICARLAANVGPRQLELYLMAEVANLQVAKTILEPLCSLPTLKEAAISLRNERHKELRALASHAALQLMSSNQYRQQSFPFLHLPLELQLHILSFTRLVCDGTIIWYPTQTFVALNGYRCGYPRLGHSDGGVIDPSIFCGSRAAAYRSRCDCIFAPVDFFLVSKDFGAVAHMMFYSQNRFIVLPSNYQPLGNVTDNADDDQRDRYNFASMMLFLTRMPHLGIRSLSHVCLVFPPCKPTYLLPEQKAWGVWLHVVDLLRQHANLPGLKLEIHFADQEVMPIEDLTRRRTRRNQEEEKEMYDTYARILAPLRNLVGLRAILIYVAWPVCENAWSDRKTDERRLEKMIMGEAYDSSSWGKQDRSSWSQPDRTWWTGYM